MPSGVRPLERAAEHRADVRVPHHFAVVAAGHDAVGLRQAPRRLVGEDDPALGVHDDHAFEHAPQDGLGARAVLRELRHSPAQFAGRIVEDSRDGAEFVAALVARRGREVSGGVPARHRGDRVDPPRQEHRGEPGQAEGAAERHRQRHQDAPAHGAELGVDLGEREREPHGAHMRVLDREGDIEQIRAQRRAEPPHDAHSRLPGRDDLRPRAVVVELLEGGQILRGVADDAAVRRDERDARGGEPADLVGLPIEGGDRAVRPAAPGGARRPAGSRRRDCARWP